MRRPTGVSRQGRRDAGRRTAHARHALCSYLDEQKKGERAATDVREERLTMEAGAFGRVIPRSGQRDEVEA